MSQIQIALGIAGLALTLALWILKSSRATEHRLSVLETKIQIFWKIIEEGAATLLHRDDTPEIDRLLEKAAERAAERAENTLDTTMDDDETEQLIEELKEVEQDPQRTKGEASAALLMRAILTARMSGKDD